MDNKAYTENEMPNSARTLSPSDISSIDGQMAKNGNANGHVNGHANGNGIAQNGDLPPKLDSDEDENIEEIQQRQRDRDPIFYCRWITSRPKTCFGK